VRSEKARFIREMRLRNIFEERMAPLKLDIQRINIQGQEELRMNELENDLSCFVLRLFFCVLFSLFIFFSFWVSFFSVFEG